MGANACTGPVARPVVVVFLITLGLAGCVEPGGSDGEQGAQDPPFTGIDESADPVPVVFEVISRSGGIIEVAGRAWLSPGASTAVLFIHGSAGGSDQFGPAAVPGYSLAHVMLASGRSAVSIDLPGYGDSPANEMLVGMEDYASVVDQIAAALRSGEYSSKEETTQAHKTLLSLGVSMGGLITDITQGMFASFDGIIPTVWSHGRYSEDAARCFSHGDCPEDPLVWTYHFENVDPIIVEDARNTTLEPMPTAVPYSPWWNCWSCWTYELRPLDDMASKTVRFDRITETIDIPVLSIQAEEDFFFEKADLGDQGDYYPNADFSLILLPETGHYWFHHLNHLDAHAQILEWMAVNGF